mmetsp:Transcript_2609/g.5321  ORF Transcript_2609/g.5321 Transcript_2609/m.5321 type:complete len:86 (-) Transcript_2609:91-348(-)
MIILDLATGAVHVEVSTVSFGKAGTVLFTPLTRRRRSKARQPIWLKQAGIVQISQEISALGSTFLPFRFWTDTCDMLVLAWNPSR